MGHAIRRPGDQSAGFDAPFLHLSHTAQRHVVVRDEEISTQEEIELAGRKDAVGPIVIHGMDHHEKVGRKQIILLGIKAIHLGRGTVVDAIVNAQLVEMEDPAQDLPRLFRRGILQIHPQEQVGIRQQTRHQKDIDVLRMQLAAGSERVGANHEIWRRG